MFEYRPVPGVDPPQPTGDWAAVSGFRFPVGGSRATARDARRARVPWTCRGWAIPTRGRPIRWPWSICDDPAALKVETFIRTGLPFGEGIEGGSSPSGVVATADRVFVSNGHNDSITVIDPKTNSVIGQIEIRIPGLENSAACCRVGMAYHEATGWLLVAEAGINAVGVIDTRQSPGKVLGHLPAAWFPSRVADRRRHGLCGQRERPRHRTERLAKPISGRRHHQRHVPAGQHLVISLCRMPRKWPPRTQTVMDNNGLTPRGETRRRAARRSEARGADREGEPHLR